VRRQHPDVAIPFEAAEVAGQPVTEKIVDANFSKRPMYYVGVIPEAFPSGYGELRTGFARKFVPATSAGDPFSYTRANLPALTAYHFPTRAYPPASWETWEATYYGGAAFDLANAYEAADVAAAERWYRKAIELAPGIPGAYKNLAILLMANAGAPSEAADLLETYLRLAPNDPEASTIRQSIAQLRGTNP
jgi:tetratricopeptide (TPR) repeat protein